MSKAHGHARCDAAPHGRPSAGQASVFAALVVFAALTTLHAGSSPAWTAFANVAEALAAALATAACVVRARRERAACGGRTGRSCLAWSLVAAGVGAWTIGQIGWSVYEGVSAAPPPNPSVLDAAFLLFPVLVVLALLTMVQTPAGRLSQVRGMVEGLFIAAGFFLLSWSLIVSSLIGQSRASTAGEAVNLAYPVLDAFALAAVLFLALRRRDDSPPGLGLLALGIACVALADSLYWYLTTVNTTFPGVSPVGTGWVAGFLLIALAALARESRPSWVRKLSDRRALLVAPVLPAALGLMAALARRLTDGDSGSVGALLTIITVVVVLAMALLAIVSYENRALTADLESRVRARTAELQSTERYYRALVHNSSDVVMAIDADLRIRYVSDSALEVFGYRPDELIGRELDVFGASAERMLVQALDRVALAAGQTTRVGWALKDSAGRERHAESAITNQLRDPHVAAFVLNTRDETDRVALEAQLREQAFHDPLTGLPNRALLSDRASQAFARSLRCGAKVGAIVIDLDAFKLVNDSLGHERGDELLREVAHRLHSVMRAEDTLARIGGDEFVALIDAVGSERDALKLAGRLRAAVAESKLCLGTSAHGVTASIGLAVGMASRTSFDQLLRDADMAMYSVKSAGKDAVQLFDASMHRQARERLRLQADLGKALERDQLWLLYQPEYEVLTGRLEGFEALVRWNHPIRGLVPPDQFISLAQESGLIVALGRWVLDQALQQATTWRRLDARSRAVSIAINLSSVQLRAPSLLADVSGALAQSSIDPARVVLEITESALVEDSHRVIGTLQALKDLGVRIAIDDFGTGYASLAYLRKMPVDILKIDRAFVRASDDGQRGRDLLEAIVGIARSLSLRTVAEGIEQPGQLAAVRSMGCDLAQGYLLGRPLPIEAAQRLIDEEDGASGARSPIVEVEAIKAFDTRNLGAQRRG